MDKMSQKITHIYVVICLAIAAVIGVSVRYILKLDLTVNETFQTVFAFCLIISVLIAFSGIYILKRQKVNFNLPKNILTIGLSDILIVFVPIWLSPTVSIRSKFVITIVSFGLTTGNYYAGVYRDKSLKK